MKIPKKFKLHGEEIKVILDNKLMYATDHRGEAKFRENSIVLAPSTPEHPCSISSIEQTFLHELMHYIFYHAGYIEDCADERKIELMGRLLHQAMITFEYDK